MRVAWMPRRCVAVQEPRGTGWEADFRTRQLQRQLDSAQYHILCLEAPKPRYPSPLKDGFVYFLKIDGHIKIGWASNLANRMRAYAPTSQLLAVEPGTRVDEAKLHKRFAVHRTHGREWYAPVPSITHHIADVVGRHGTPDPVAFAAKPVTIPTPRGYTPRRTVRG